MAGPSPELPREVSFGLRWSLLPLGELREVGEDGRGFQEAGCPAPLGEDGGAERAPHTRIRLDSSAGPASGPGTWPSAVQPPEASGQQMLRTEPFSLRGHHLKC